MENWLQPLITRFKGTISRWNSLPSPEDRPLPDWKNKALHDFRNWLSEAPDEDISGKEAQNFMEGVDLYTVLKEFAALRQEIKLQNREQNRAVKSLSTFIDDYKDTADLFRDRTAQISLLEEKLRLSAEKNVASQFFDIRDALIRGRNAARTLVGEKRFFMPREKIEGLKEGYEMAIRRFDRALSGLGIDPIETEGKKFDPETMRAIGSVHKKGVEPGFVVEEERSGYVRKKEVLRTAEVIVNK